MPPSKEAQKIIDRTRSELMERYASGSVICLECNTPVTYNGRGRPSEFCSKTCGDRHRKRKIYALVSPVRVEVMPCKNCGTTFESLRGSGSNNKGQRDHCSNKCARAWGNNAKNHPPARVAKMQANRRLWCHKVTPERFEQMRTEQNNRCLICADEMSSPHIDHDHACCSDRYGSCGECVRGLLCPHCNRGLGQFMDNPERLIAAASYLKNYRAK